jgi:GNAT superfamily N-acetyltransferase
LDWSTLGGAAAIRPYAGRDYDEVRTFTCATPGQNFTRDAQRVIRKAPDEIGADFDDDVWIGVAEISETGIVGVVIYQVQVIGRAPDGEARPFIAALGVRRDFRRRGIATLLKTAAMLDMADRGISGPTVSLVNRRNVAMMQLNTTRFDANAEPDPDSHEDLVVTVAIEPVA